MTTAVCVLLAWMSLAPIMALVLAPLWLRDRRRGTPWIGDDPEEAADLADYYRSRFRVIDGGLG